MLGMLENQMMKKIFLFVCVVMMNPGGIDAQVAQGSSCEALPSSLIEEVTLRVLRACAGQGHLGSQYTLGVMYASGNGVPQDYAEAVRWFRLAAEGGHAEAQNNLGVMYRNGDGVPQDYAEAARWFRLADEQASESNQSNLTTAELRNHPISINVPAGWEVAPDSIVRVLNEGMREISGPVLFTEVIGLLSPIGSIRWTAHPYVLIRWDTVSVPDYETLESEMRDAGALMPDIEDSLDEVLGPLGMENLEFGSQVFNQESGILWLQLEVDDLTNGPTIATSGSMFYPNGRVGVTYYGAADRDVSFGIGIVESTLKELSVEGASPFRGAFPSDSTVMTTWEQEWWVALVLLVLVGGLLFLVRNEARQMLLRYIGWVAIISGLGLWLPAKLFGVGPMADMGTAQGFVLLAILCWGGLVLTGIGSKDGASSDVEVGEND